MSKGSGYWPFGNWPGKGQVETKSESDSRQRLRELAAKVATEKDHDKFVELVKELNQLLDADLRRLHDAAPATDT
jgi:hypothetical protein